MIRILTPDPGGEARRKVEAMKTEMNEMRVRTAQLENHAHEKMQEAEEIKKRKFMCDARIKQLASIVLFVAMSLGIGLGVKFGIF